MKVYINGEFFDEKKAKISVLDKGFLYGYGAYVTTRLYNKKPFLLDEQIKKLIRSAKFLKIKTPTIGKIKTALQKTIQENNLDNATLRITLSAGINNKPSLTIIPKELTINQEIYKGVRVITVKAHRVMPEIKTSNCIPSLLARKLAKKRRAYEAILIDQEDFVREGSRSNIFFIKNNVLFTPDRKILKGETRNLTLKLAKKIMKINLCEIEKKNMYKADECFITHTSGEIVPVVKIDNKKINKGKLGRMTLKLIEVFKNATP